MSNLYRIEIPAEKIQIPGLNEIEVHYNSGQKVFEVFVNRKKMARKIGIKAREAYDKMHHPEFPEEYFQVNRALNSEFGIDIEQLKVKNRKREIVIPRMMAMNWLKENTKYSLQFIGNLFQPEGESAFDHATVLHAVKTVQNDRDTDKNYNEKYTEFEKKANKPLVKYYESN